MIITVRVGPFTAFLVALILVATSGGQMLPITSFNGSLGMNAGVFSSSGNDDSGAEPISEGISYPCADWLGRREKRADL